MQDKKIDSESFKKTRGSLEEKLETNGVSKESIERINRLIDCYFNKEKLVHLDFEKQKSFKAEKDLTFDQNYAKCITRP